MLSVVNKEAAVADGRSMLDEILREGAQRMLAAALEAEVDAYVAELTGERDEAGHRLVSRNGHARPRVITTVAGAVGIRAPRVEDRRVDPETNERAKFKSSIVPPWCRKSPKVTEVLPLLYLHGLATGDFAPALEGFFGSAAGLSASVITRLTTAWQTEHRAFMERSLADRDYVYVGADGVHFTIRLEEERLCCLVIVGVRPDGTKELVAIADGYRSGSGRRCGRSFPRPKSTGVGCTNRRTSLMRCRSRSSRSRERCWARSATPRTAIMRETPPRPSTTSSGRSGRRPRPRSETTSTCCSPSTTSPPSTGST
jgi:transposase-like protein